MKRISMGVFLSAMLWNTGCADTPPPAEAPAEPPAAVVVEEPLIRIVNAGPSRVDLMAGGDALFADVAFGKSTVYKPKPPETTLLLRTTIDAEDLSSDDRELLVRKHYTVVALPAGQSPPGMAILSDDLGALAPGIARVRLINAATNGEEMDLYRAGGTDPILHGMAAGTGEVTYLDMEEGPVEVHSTSRPGLPLIAKLNVEEDHFYTFIVVGAGGAWDVVQIMDDVGP